MGENGTISKHPYCWCPENGHELSNSQYKFSACKKNL
jgi:hypothetical protein